MDRARLVHISIIFIALCSVLSTAAYGADRIGAERAFIEAQKSLAEGDDVRAEKHLMSALELDPGFTSAIWQLSQIYEKRGRLEYARELIIRGLGQQPDASWARDRLAQIERTLGRKLLGEAENYMDTGRYDLAVPKLSRYIGLRPDDTIALEMLGRCHLAMGNLKTSKGYLLQAVNRDPSNRAVASLLDEVEERLSRPSVDALVAEARETLAGYKPGEPGGAREAIGRVLAVDPGNVWAREKLAELDLLEQQRQADLAEEGRRQAKEAIEKGIEVVKTIEEPAGRVRSVLQSNVSIILLCVICALLVLMVKRKSTVRTYPLQGSATLIPLLDIVSLLNANMKTGRLVVTGSRERGEIFFEKGEIVHARFRDQDGRQAFHSLMGIKSGQYVFFNRLPNVRHTVNEPLSLLLLSMKSAGERKSAAPTARPRPEKTTV